VTRPAIHEQVDDVLGPGREVRLLGSERIRRVRVQQIGQGESAEADSRANKEVAAGEHESLTYRLG
jgi:hypothetical protein